MSVAHVVPIKDLVEHDVRPRYECPCGPIWRQFPAGWVIVHHSLDGRDALGQVPFEAEEQ